MDIAQLYSYFNQCTSVATDTRKIEPDTLFIALKGDNFNANTFAEEALVKGAKYAVVDDPEYKTNERILLVENSLTALQELANFHRKTLGLPVIALTGSNGKTTTKELINTVLSAKYNTRATVGNLNNHIGVPLTILSFTKETEIGIVEMGANHQKEIEFLCSIAEPNFGYITNFGKAHLEGFGGYEGVIKGKSELYTYLKNNTKTAFVNLDDTIQKEKTATISRYTFAINNPNGDVNIKAVTATPMVKVVYNSQEIQTNLIGSYNAPNISAAIAIGSYFKVSDSKIKKALEGYTPNNNRSQLIDKNSNKIILDAYNANPSSMSAAINNFLQLEGKNKTAVLGDMFELGIESMEEHKKIINLLANVDTVAIYFVGKAFFANKIEKENIHFFESFDTFSKKFANKNIQNNTLLIKGSRGMALERVLEVL
ncbi:UDP-N-acetylmuramoyl-tripeptide--D-alanyl-D-alanine ligase [Flavobacterium arcticum]|uniref:UDP-N-acetylmuramoyl-tripeptide--D-alanyl-D-alanine ligase n=1 Tax=Flavobacterium arcticum TaxID=1784713 RepID=A0A345H8Y3_9FLAO|nr:UDP-N-acetylmuramoyl-tripeptide--D-alanyl-D-alanine ligase [Flavobacterium arcticum]AXG73043.1 UDP-N-acetylmuramoyl-tripeptide--D-alanyl-D-alanine ligase [Flavobacterium arcticum]KAF2510294.1 UDP-N-acetylmuramoyl-tripeptide--D-alanyl-D-alanine ligase [Flavobacterium arcticum]